MAGLVEPMTRLLTIFNDFKMSIGTADGTSKGFTVEKDSFEDASLLKSRNQTPAGMQTNVAVLVGLIYPSSEPFKQYALRIEIHVPSNYPYKPPEVYMLTKVRHPNIDKDGRICSARLDYGKTWKRESLITIVELITDLLDKPEVNYVIDTEMGSLYDSDKDKYNQILTTMIEKDGIPRI